MTVIKRSVSKFMYGGFCDNKLHKELSPEGYLIPAIFCTKKEAMRYYEDVRRLVIIYEEGA